MIDHVFGKGRASCLVPVDYEVSLRCGKTHMAVLLFVYFLKICFNQLIELSGFKISIANS